MKQQKSAGLVVYCLKNNEPYFLMLKYQTYWGFTKGLLEEGEDNRTAAIREAEEEAGLKNLEILQDFEEKQSFFFKLDGELIKKDCTFFLAKTSESQASETKISLEHGDFCWLRLNDAIQKTRIKANKELLKKAYEFILKYERANPRGKLSFYNSSG